MSFGVHQGWSHDTEQNMKIKRNYFSCVIEFGFRDKLCEAMAGLAHTQQAP